MKSPTKLFKETNSYKTLLIFSKKKKADAIKRNVGRRCGRLVILKRLEIHPRRNYYLCRCDCGNLTKAVIGKLNNGEVKSCGCLRRENSRAMLYIHGMKGTRFYRIWMSMKTRTLNPHSLVYQRYGARGISLCKSWKLFLNFKKDMYASYIFHVGKYGEKNTSIERTNNNLGYSKSNCKWATSKEQSYNRRPKTKC